MEKQDKLNMHTSNLADNNFAALAAMFPNAVTETVDENGEVIRTIDADVLAQEINTRVVSGKEERYQFTWPDKKKSVILANEPIAATLRPVREDESASLKYGNKEIEYTGTGSLNFGETENLYIEGDNLEVLKLLRETYLNRVKMIYIDPPYNTGSDFIYEDDFVEDIGEFLRRDGQYDKQGNRLITNFESNGRFHTDWLNMMYPRLRIARDLLADDGVIIINMDENEITNLQKLCVEIFGPNNDLGTIIWDKRNPKGSVKGVSYQHEYILVYAKNATAFAQKCKMQRPKRSAQSMLDKASQLFNKISEKYTFEQANKDYTKWVAQQPGLTGGEKAYNSFDSNGDVFRPVSMAAPDKPETRSHRPLLHPVTKKTCPVPAKGWRFPDKSMDQLLSKGEILFGTDENTQPNRKYLLKENMYVNISSLLYYGGSDTDLLSKLGIPFDTPKVVDIVKEHIQAMTMDGDIILDFFSGSATTAHAVMQLNAEEATKRKFIMVQIPEPCDEKSEAYKAGFKNICEIGKERIRRAGTKIKDEAGLVAQNLDIGFRVLKLDSSNMKEVYYTPEEYSQMGFNLEGFMDNIKSDRSDEDLLFQVMLDLGIPLSARIQQSGKIYSVNGNYLIACFDKIDTSMITEIAQKQPYYVVFRDSSFVNDSALVNVEQIFNTYSPSTVRRVL